MGMTRRDQPSPPVYGGGQALFPPRFRGERLPIYAGGTTSTVSGVHQPGQYWFGELGE